MTDEARAGTLPETLPQVRLCRVSDEPLGVDRLLAAIADPSVGGIGLFLGVVRDHDDGREVNSLDYSQHPSATARLEAVAQRVADAFDVVAIAVEHRIGHLEVGDLAVVVAVGAVHRHSALEACHRLIDDLKLEVPIWKEQHFASGNAEWVGLS